MGLSLESNFSTIVVGHGSRESSANASFEQLVSNYRQFVGSQNDVRTAYVELAKPSLEEAIDEAASDTNIRKIVLFPFLLFSAGHAKNDLPLNLAKARKKYPHTSFSIACPFGVHPKVASVLSEKLEQLTGKTPQERSKTTVLVVGRGSSDPDANGDFLKVVRIATENLGFEHVLTSFIGITTPLVGESLEWIARIRPKHLVVVPYFFFSGRLFQSLETHLEKFSKRYPWIKIQLGNCLGEHPKLFEVMKERVEYAVDERKVLPCDTCQYRIPLPGLIDRVGGLKALLWSLRHSFTHNQAMPHEHAHVPLQKHVLVCTNVDCNDKGGSYVLDRMRRTLREKGMNRKIRVTRTSCMGRCGEGPTVAVYPDGIWYRKVQETDVENIVSDHLMNDRLVADLVDNIMQ